MTSMAADLGLASARAGCADDPDLMYPTRVSAGRGAAPTVEERAALAVCAGCAMLGRCREESLELELPGAVAGGLTEQQRRDVRARTRGLDAGRGPAELVGVGAATAAVLGAQHEHEDARTVDPLTVDALVAGYTVPVASKRETALAAVALVTQHHRSTRDVALALKVEQGTVGYWLARYRAGQAVVGHRPRPTPSSPATPESAVTATPAAELAPADVRTILTEHYADPTIVAAIADGAPVATASRWELALASVVLTEARGVARAATARVLGETPAQVRRWATRHQSGAALIPASTEPGAELAGTGRLPRPSTAEQAVGDTVGAAA